MCFMLCVVSLVRALDMLDTYLLSTLIEKCRACQKPSLQSCGIRLVRVIRFGSIYFLFVRFQFGSNDPTHHINRDWH